MMLETCFFYNGPRADAFRPAKLDAIPVGSGGDGMWSSTNAWLFLSLV